MPSKGWNPPSKCVWSDHNFSPEILPVSHHYKNLKTFFVRQLGVPSPTLGSQVEELQILCSSQKKMSEKFPNVKTLIKEINLWEPRHRDLEVLLNKKVVPIIDEHGREQLIQPKGTFAIVDHQKYGDLFSRKVPVFAMSFEELVSVRNFLIALGLDTRHMSRLARETSNAKNSFKDKVLSEQLRERALALIRCVLFIIHRCSSRLTVPQMYSLLRGS